MTPWIPVVNRKGEITFKPKDTMQRPKQEINDIIKLLQILFHMEAEANDKENCLRVKLMIEALRWANGEESTFESRFLTPMREKLAQLVKEETDKEGGHSE